MALPALLPSFPMRLLSIVAALALMFTVSPARASDLIAPFVGEYTGSAEVVSADGARTPRDMSVKISANNKGFTVEWTSTTHRPDGSFKSKSYAIDFLPTERNGLFSAGMKRNVFGHAVQLDPMKGEPFVWGRIRGDTMTMFSLFVDETGDYEIQQFDRTLTEGGLDLRFIVTRNGLEQRSVETFLKRK